VSCVVGLRRTLVDRASRMRFVAMASECGALVADG